MNSMLHAVDYNRLMVPPLPDCGGATAMCDRSEFPSGGMGTVLYNWCNLKCLEHFVFFFRVALETSIACDIVNHSLVFFHLCPISRGLVDKTDIYPFRYWTSQGELSDFLIGKTSPKAQEQQNIPWQLCSVLGRSWFSGTIGWASCWAFFEISTPSAKKLQQPRFFCNNFPDCSCLQDVAPAVLGRRGTPWLFWKLQVARAVKVQNSMRGTIELSW